MPDESDLGADICGVRSDAVAADERPIAFKILRRRVSIAKRFLRWVAGLLLLSVISAVAANFPILRAFAYPVCCCFIGPEVSVSEMPLICTTREKPVASLTMSGVTRWEWRIFKTVHTYDGHNPYRWHDYTITPDGATDYDNEYAHEERRKDVLWSRVQRVVTKIGLVTPVDWNRSTSVLQCDKPLPPGDYVSVAKGFNDLRRTSVLSNVTFFRVTDLGLIVKYDSDRFCVQAIDLNTRRVIKGVDIFVYTRTNEDVFEVVDKTRTRADGLGIVKKKERHDHFNWYGFVLDARWNGQRAFAGRLSHCSPSQNHSHFVYFHGDFYGYGWADSRSFITTDRPVYRLGQTIKFQGFARISRPGSLSMLKSRDVKFEVTRRIDQNPIWAGNTRADEFGCFSGSFVMPETAHTGEYVLSAEFPDHRCAKKTIQVEQYRKPEYKVTIVPSAPYVVSGEKLKFKVLAEYFFGGPVANARVDYSIRSVRSRSAREKLAEAKQHAFYDLRNASEDCPLVDTSRSDVVEGSAITTELGEASIDVDTRPPARGEEKQALDAIGYSDREFLISATVVDLSRKTVEASSSAVVTSADLALILSLESSVLRSGQMIGGNVKVLDYERHPIGGQRIDLKFIRIELDNAGKEKVSSIRQTSITADANGDAHFEVPTDENLTTGLYHVIANASDKRSRPVGDAKVIWLAGSNTQSNDSENELSIRPDREVYRLSDRAHLTITAPLGRGEKAELLLTVEGEKIYRCQTVTITGPVQDIELPLEPKFVPNAFVSVSFLNNRHAPLEKATTIRVAPDEKFVKLAIKPSAHFVLPGKEVECDIDVTNHGGNPVSDATMCLSVCDESLFAVSPARSDDLYGCPAPDIFHAMYPMVRNNVCTKFSFDEYCVPRSDMPPVIYDGGFVEFLDPRCYYPRSQNDQRELYGERMRNAKNFFATNMGGSDVLVPIGNSYRGAGRVVHSSTGPVFVWPVLTPTSRSTSPTRRDLAQLKTGTDARVRQNFSDVAAWLPRVKTDKRGHAHVRFKMPDDLTTWRVSAVAMTRKDKVGADSTTITTSQDFIGRLALPRFYSQFDRTQITAVLHNNSEQMQPVTLNLSVSPEIEVQDENEASISIPAGGSARHSWKIRPSMEGKATIKLVAVGRSSSDAVETQLPVYSFCYRPIFAKGGIIKDNRSVRNFPIKIPDGVDRTTGRFELSMSSSSIGPVLGSFEKLIEYPYGCTEQTLSRMIPSVVAMRLHKNLGAPLSKADGTKFDGVYKAAMAKLNDYQHFDGGWGWWKDDSSNVYLTAHVLEGLHHLREAGYDVDQQRVRKGLDYLGQNVFWKSLESDSLDDDIDRAKAIYVLSLYGRKMEPLSKIWQLARMDKMSPETLCYLVMAFKRVGEDSSAKRVYERLLELRNESDGFVEWNHTEGLLKKIGVKDSYYTFRFTGVETTALALRAVVAIEPDNDQLIESITRWLILQRDENGWNNTKCTAAVFLAMLEKELAIGKGRVTKFDATIRAGASALQLLKFVKQVERGTRSFTVAGKKLPQAVELTKNGPGWLYYSSLLSYERPLIPGQDLIAKALPADLKISRDLYRVYSDDSGKTYRAQLLNPISSKVSEGEYVLMRTKVDSPVSAPYVMIEQPLPSGAEVIDNSVEWRWSKEQEKENEAYLPQWGHQDILDDKVVLFVDHLGSGKVKFDTLMRMEMPGTFNVRPVDLQAVYSKKFRGYSSAASLVVNAKD